MRELSHEIVQKQACDNNDNLCYHLKPYSAHDLALDTSLTRKEKELNIKRYQNSCDNRNGVIQACCSKNKKDIQELDEILRKMKKTPIYGKSVYNQTGNLESIELCDKDTITDCGKGFQKLNSYELCKIPQDTNMDNLDGLLIDKFNKDCYSSQCDPQEKLAGIDGKYDEEYTFEFDKLVATAIKNNKLDNLKHYLKEDPKLKQRVLTHSGDGNTIYHEAFQHKAQHIIVYLFKNVTSEQMNRLNSKGETLLHMAMRNDDPNSIQMCLKLGADINAINRHRETPIYNAIRERHYHNVLVALNNHADIYHQNKEKETPFIVACTTKKRHLDIVRLIVNNGANIDDQNKDGKTILVSLLEKENLSQEKMTPENRESKLELDLNVEDEKIRTFLQNIKIKKLKLDLGKELSPEDTKKLEGILYLLDKKKDYEGRMYDFTLTVDFDPELEYPEELHYPKDGHEDFMKPYQSGEKSFSHEPLYLKYKNMHRDRLVDLKKIIQLTEWDNKRNEKEKSQIIDDIMTGKKSLDNYKHLVFHENGITQEQNHLLDNLDENSLFEFQDPHRNETEKVQVKSKRTENEEGDLKNTPFNIDIGTEKELREKNQKLTVHEILGKEIRDDYESIVESPMISDEVKKTLWEKIKQLLVDLNLLQGTKSEKLKQGKNQIVMLETEIKNNKTLLNKLEDKSKNRTFLLVSGISLSMLVALMLVVLIKRKNINLNLQNSLSNYVRNYGG